MGRAGKDAHAVCPVRVQDRPLPPRPHIKVNRERDLGRLACLASNQGSVGVAGVRPGKRSGFCRGPRPSLPGGKYLCLCATEANWVQGLKGSRN